MDPWGLVPCSIYSVCPVPGQQLRSHARHADHPQANKNRLVAKRRPRKALERARQAAPCRTGKPTIMTPWLKTGNKNRPKPQQGGADQTQTSASFGPSTTPKKSSEALNKPLDTLAPRWRGTKFITPLALFCTKTSPAVKLVDNICKRLECKVLKNQSVHKCFACLLPLILLLPRP